MKKIILPIIIIFLLSSCTGEEDKIEIKKQDFNLETISFSGFTKEALLSKSGKIKSSQNIALNSTANGRVKNILVRDGDSVLEGQIIAELDDSVTNYGLMLDRARAGLNRANISYDSNKITLDKSVFDAELNVKKLQNNLKALINDSKESIKKAESDLENTDINLENSKGSLEIKKVENTILKAELDYENKLIADNETLESFYSTIKKEYNSMTIFFDDVIEFSDTLYGITKLNDDENDKFDSFLGAKNTTQKNKTKMLIKELIKFSSNDFTQIDINKITTKEELEEALLLINEGYTKTKELLNEIEGTLNNSISSTNSFSLADIANYTATVNVYQGSLQGNYTSFIVFDNTINSFVRTYINNQKSILKSIELMKKDLEILKKTFSVNSTLAEVGFNKTIINTNDAISSLEIQVNSAENSLLNAKQIREVYLKNILNEINDAKINYNTSKKEFEKLTISSPINGTISRVNIDIGQEISIGTPTFGIVNETEAEVNISFNRDELSLVAEGDTVYVVDEENTYTGSIYSLSQTADDNLKYRSVIAIDEGVNIIGNIVTVSIPVELENILVPLDIVKINDSGLGTMNILKELTSTGSTGTGSKLLEIDQLEVKIGDIYEDRIEIINEIDGTEQIILNYVDNFDKDKFILKVK